MSYSEILTTVAGCCFIGLCLITIIETFRDFNRR